MRSRLGIPDQNSEQGEGSNGASNGWYEDWDPAAAYTPQDVENLADRGEDKFRKSTINNVPRDKWITPLLDFDAVAGGLDLDQERSEQNQRGEALANKEESQQALRYIGRLVAIPLVTGFLISRALADPILNFTLKNNPEAFAMTEIQKIEGARAVHVEEARIRMDVAIGKIAPRSEAEILMHLAEFAAEVQEEERHHNEETLITAVSDSISGMTLFGILATEMRGRDALFNTLGRLFDGLSDIAKAVMIILVADTLLGYHSEEGWHGLIELVLGHYGVEPSEEGVVIFVGTVPVLIDVFFKYWIFIGLNRISPGAVVTIKQVRACCGRACIRIRMRARVCCVGGGAPRGMVCGVGSIRLVKLHAGMPFQVQLSSRRPCSPSLASSSFLPAWPAWLSICPDRAAARCRMRACRSIATDAAPLRFASLGAPAAQLHEPGMPQPGDALFVYV